MKNLKNTLKIAFYNAQIAVSTAAGYTGAALGMAVGDAPSAVFALGYGSFKADQARLKKQVTKGL